MAIVNEEREQRDGANGRESERLFMADPVGSCLANRERCGL
jgi:hypothetical protein